MNKRPRRTKGKCYSYQLRCVAVMPHLKLWDIKGLTHFWRGNAPRLGRGK